MLTLIETINFVIKYLISLFKLTSVILSLLLLLLYATSLWLYSMFLLVIFFSSYPDQKINQNNLSYL